MTQLNRIDIILDTEIGGTQILVALFKLYEQSNKDGLEYTPKIARYLSKQFGIQLGIMQVVVKNFVYSRLARQFVYEYEKAI